MSGQPRKHANNQPQITAVLSPASKPKDDNVVDFVDQSGTPLNTVLGRTIVIVAAQISQKEFKGKMGSFSELTLTDGVTYFTFSKVIADQLSRMIPTLDEGKHIRARVEEKSAGGVKYLTLTSATD